MTDARTYEVGETLNGGPEIMYGNRPSKNMYFLLMCSRVWSENVAAVKKKRSSFKFDSDHWG
jgi:hypothetical protein